MALVWDWEFTNNNQQIQQGTKNITAATATNPVVITSASHGYNNGDGIRITNVSGMTQLNSINYIVANKTADTLELTDGAGVNIDGSAFSAYTSGGIIRSVAILTGTLYNNSTAGETIGQFTQFPDYYLSAANAANITGWSFLFGPTGSFFTQFTSLIDAGTSRTFIMGRHYQGSEQIVDVYGGNYDIRLKLKADGSDAGTIENCYQFRLGDTDPNDFICEEYAEVPEVISTSACVNVLASTFSGLDHLNGETVKILADGVVLGDQVVSGGLISLPASYGIVHVGLGYYSDLETLNVEIGNDRDTTTGKKLKVGNVSLSFVESIGGWLGDSENTIYEAFTNLVTTHNQSELIFNEDYTTLNSGTVLYTGWIRRPLNSKFKYGARVFFRNKDPRPVMITAISPEIHVGGTG